jgi:S-adenosylmethionine:tRNA ribosyltransferase-isomerase
MHVNDFDFDLPPELIAQAPAVDRTSARLLHLDRATGAIVHTSISALPELLSAGDLLVLNNTRVFPARLLGHRVPSGGAVECLLVKKEVGILFTKSEKRIPTSFPDDRPGEVWEALMHPGQKLRPGDRVVFEGVRTIHGEILERHYFGRRLVRLWIEDGSSVDEAIDAIGHVPLPPYIKRPDLESDRDRYQTVFARERGSVAAPTAGLHFTPEMLAALRQNGVETAEITLHVGYGTFQPVRVDRVEDHRVEAESYDIPPRAASAIDAARAGGRRIVAVGTTTTRTLEAAASANAGRIAAGAGTTDLFIYPGFQFGVVGALMTNFHLPRSSLLMLVAAFAGRDLALNAYHAAIAERYRFYSYGDAMLIT